MDVYISGFVGVYDESFGWVKWLCFLSCAMFGFDESGSVCSVGSVLQC